ncbi:MAG TPA: acetyltransferase [Sedimentisphaerales bacterium]|nr:acetyltransferase [Sedimentisphaerales bacterium]
MTDARPCILLGAGGHAKVVLAVAHAQGLSILGVCDPKLAGQRITHWRGLAVLGKDDVIYSWRPDQCRLLNGIGPNIQSSTRSQLYNNFRREGFSFPVLKHPHAWVDETACLGEGTQVMAGAVIQSDTSILENTVINTSASIDHDCRVGSNVHIAPGAIICGGVTIGDFAYIGSGAIIIQNIHVGSNAIIGAGTTIVRNVIAESKVIGNNVHK